MAVSHPSGTRYTGRCILAGIPMATDDATPAATGPLPRAERQESILHGAAAAFARTGYAATSMEDIAAASGITKLIVYRHFDSKEELYRAVLQRVFDRLAEEFVDGVRERAGDGDRRAHAPHRRPRGPGGVPAALAARGPRAAVRRVRP